MRASSEMHSATARSRGDASHISARVPWIGKTFLVGQGSGTLHSLLLSGAIVSSSRPCSWLLYSETSLEGEDSFRGSCSAMGRRDMGHACVWGGASR